MTDKQIEILSPIFTNLAIWKERYLSKFNKSNNTILSNFDNYNHIKTKQTIGLMNCLLTDFILEKNKIKGLNKTLCVLFNPLSFFPIGETMHSFLIANIINPNSEHGQGDLFLKSFLKKLDVEVYENDNWIVTAEIGRIDILIKRENPHTVIVIENKSNYAIDQENQIYRYWYQEIYLPNKKQLKPISEENYHIIYLTPSEYKVPEKHSLLRPKEYDENLPEIVPLKPKIWQFNKEIKDWLKNSINELHSENHRLREYIKQYIELWN